MTIADTQAHLEALQHRLADLLREVQTVIVGQDDVLRASSPASSPADTASSKASPVWARR
ncbi:hypothetical protein [Nannocystis pusilla]|uniref:hypothetical protein n=1 Tax=Nannocystis pusilla TaxID=889268 RepID=UPI003B7E57B9